MFNLFRLCRKDEISFGIVAETGNIVAKNGNNAEKILQLVAFDNVAWTLLLVWTGPYALPLSFLIYWKPLFTMEMIV